MWCKLGNPKPQGLIEDFTTSLEGREREYVVVGGLAEDFSQKGREWAKDSKPISFKLNPWFISPAKHNKENNQKWKSELKFQDFEGFVEWIQDMWCNLDQRVWETIFLKTV